MSYKLNPKLKPFLVKSTKDGQFTARLTGSNGKKATLELGDEVSVAVKVADLGISMAGATGAQLEFDSEGVLIGHTLDEAPKITKTASRGHSGAVRARQTSQF